MAILSLADFNENAPWVVAVLVGTATVTVQGGLNVDRQRGPGTTTRPPPGDLERAATGDSLMAMDTHHDPYTAGAAD